MVEVFLKSIFWHYSYTLDINTFPFFGLVILTLKKLWDSTHKTTGGADEANPLI